MTRNSKYLRSCNGVDIDVYDVLKAFGVSCPGRQHAIKKLLCAGQRGEKTEYQDLLEAYAAVSRAIDLHREEWPANEVLNVHD